MQDGLLCSSGCSHDGSKMAPHGLTVASEFRTWFRDRCVRWSYVITLVQKRWSSMRLFLQQLKQIHAGGY